MIRQCGWQIDVVICMNYDVADDVEGILFLAIVTTMFSFIALVVIVLIVIIVLIVTIVTNVTNVVIVRIVCNDFVANTYHRT